MNIKVFATLFLGLASVDAIVVDSRVKDYLKSFAGNPISIQSGDVTNTSAVVWARCNSEEDSKVTVVYSPIGVTKMHGQYVPIKFEESMTGYATGATDYTIKFNITGLSPSTTYEYRFKCAAYHEECRNVDHSPRGSFKTAPAPRDKGVISFVWGGDLAGQGWGRNPYLEITHVDGELITGGYVAFETMRKLQPDFAIFQGNMIHADNAIPTDKEIPVAVGGGMWMNDPPKNFIATTLAEYRANWKYNLADRQMQKFLEEVPVYVQWGEHEVTNNWWPGETLDKAPYNGLPVDFLAERSRQALYEFNPISGTSDDAMYRKFQHGCYLELFLIDGRSYRGPNLDQNKETGTAMLGRQQLEWLKMHLMRSESTYKIISSQQPLSVVSGRPTDFDAWGQDSPSLLGREVELKELLSFIRMHSIKGVVFIGSDVDYAAAIKGDPANAGTDFVDFAPYYEFVVGSIGSGSFGALGLDTTFGSAYEFVRSPSTSGLPQNLPPPNLNSFGHAFLDDKGVLTVEIIDITGAVIYSKAIDSWL